MCFPSGSAGKESAYNTGELGSIPGLGRSPVEGKGYPFQYSGLYSPWGRKESDKSEPLSLHFTSVVLEGLILPQVHWLSAWSYQYCSRRWNTAAIAVRRSRKTLFLLFSCSVVWIFTTPWTVGPHAPLSLSFCRQEYWSGLPFPPPGDLPDPGIELQSPAL